MLKVLQNQESHREATTDACRVCSPLGAAVAFRGIEGGMPLLHGSQGCSTYIRRYLISHFREPIDIASSNFHEQAAIFGGRDNLRLAIQNVVRQYEPQLIGVATTCLSETIGDDVTHYLRELLNEDIPDMPQLVHVSTASYRGSHDDGFRSTLRALVSTIGASQEKGPSASVGAPRVNLLAPLLSPSDLRHLKDLGDAYDVALTLLPDYSDTLDGPLWSEYHRIPPGGTKVEDIAKMSSADLSIELGQLANESETAGGWLHDNGVPLARINIPVGVKGTDNFLDLLGEVSGRPRPASLEKARGRLVDSYVDAHKYVFQKRVALYADPDLLVALCAFLGEIGMTPVVAATGSKNPNLEKELRALPHFPKDGQIIMDADFRDIEDALLEHRPDLVVGSGKGFKSARNAGIPLVRVGFPIHDRFGASRIKHIGYQGTQELFDRIVNALLETRQARSSVGWTYL